MSILREYPRSHRVDVDIGIFDMLHYFEHAYWTRVATRCSAKHRARIPFIANYCIPEHIG